MKYTSTTLFSKSKILVLFAAAFSLGLGLWSHSTEAQDQSTVASTNFRIVAQTAAPGTQVSIPIEIDSLGTETAAGFTVSFDPNVLSNPVLSVGAGASAGMEYDFNPNVSGKIGIAFDSVNAFVASPPARQVMVIKFNVAAGAAPGTTAVTFASTPTPKSTSDGAGNLIPTTYQDGFVIIPGPANPTISISGKISIPTGQGLLNAKVTLKDSSNHQTSVFSSSLGFYSFDNVAAGQTFTISVASKRYRFAPRSVTTSSSNMTNVDFTGTE